MNKLFELLEKHLMGPLSKLAVRRMAPMTERNMNRTLERIAELLAAS